MSHRKFIRLQLRCASYREEHDRAKELQEELCATNKLIKTKVWEEKTR